MNSRLYYLIKIDSYFLPGRSFGIKPLILAKEGCSSGFRIKSIICTGVQPKFSEQTLMHIFTHQYPLSNQSLFSEIEQLPPGHFMMVNDSGITIQSYWDIPTAQEELDLSPSQAERHFEDLLQRAVRRRLRSEVPKAVYLSGGIDSATILRLASDFEAEGKLPCYGVQFEISEYDESALAQQIATYCGQEYHPFL